MGHGIDDCRMVQSLVKKSITKDYMKENLAHSNKVTQQSALNQGYPSEATTLHKIVHVYIILQVIKIALSTLPRRHADQRA